jgi:hypothetical protein
MDPNHFPLTQTGSTNAVNLIQEKSENSSFYALALLGNISVAHSRAIHLRDFQWSSMWQASFTKNIHVLVPAKEIDAYWPLHKNQWYNEACSRTHTTN